MNKRHCNNNMPKLNSRKQRSTEIRMWVANEKGKLLQFKTFCHKQMVFTKLIGSSQNVFSLLPIIYYSITSVLNVRVTSQHVLITYIVVYLMQVVYNLYIIGISPFMGFTRVYHK